jgi:uncharacterized membrane protein YbhN (UPF0104 family)
LVHQLCRRHGYRLEGVIVSQLVEKLAEIFTLWLFAIPTAWLLRGSEPLAPALAGVVGAVLVVALAALFWGRRLRTANGQKRNRYTALLDRTSSALRLSLQPAVGRPVLFWSFVANAVDVAMVGLCLQAVGINLGVGAWCLVLLVINVAICVPVSAANLGVLEAGAAVALVHLGAPGSAAMAFAILYAAHVVPVTLIGVLEFRKLRWAAAPPS